MAKAGDEIFNPRTGQRMIFLETGAETSGELVRIDSYNPPTGVAEPEHVHPFQQSGAEVVSGALAPVGRMFGHRPEYPYPYGGRGEELLAAEGEQALARSGSRRGAVGVTVIAFILLLALLLWQRRRGSRR